MKLSKEDIKEFKTMYLEQYNKVLTDSEAEILAMKLLQYLDRLKNFKLPVPKLHLDLNTSYNSNATKLHNRSSVNGMPKGRSRPPINSPSDDVVLSQ